MLKGMMEAVVAHQTAAQTEAQRRLYDELTQRISALRTEGKLDEALQAHAEAGAALEHESGTMSLAATAVSKTIPAALEIFNKLGIEDVPVKDREGYVAFLTTLAQNPDIDFDALIKAVQEQQSLSIESSQSGSALKEKKERKLGDLTEDQLLTAQAVFRTTPSERTKLTLDEAVELARYDALKELGEVERGAEMTKLKNIVQKRKRDTIGKLGNYIGMITQNDPERRMNFSEDELQLLSEHPLAQQIVRRIGEIETFRDKTWDELLIYINTPKEVVLAYPQQPNSE